MTYGALAVRFDIGQKAVPADVRLEAGFDRIAPLSPEHAYAFGRFRLDVRRRELFADGRPVALGGRALDVLSVLIEARGGLVTKDELFSRVWPRTVVEENALQFQISTIRKALGPDRDFIKTISGRGYRFVARIATPVPARGPAALLALDVSDRRAGSIERLKCRIEQLEDEIARQQRLLEDVMSRAKDTLQLAVVLLGNKPI